MPDARIIKMPSRYGSDRCQCGHTKAYHSHLRPGTDCAQRGCDCTKYKRPRRWLR